MQASAQKNEFLTSGKGLQYVLFEKQESRRKEGLLQRIHIRTSQRCPSCKGRFKDLGNDFVCPSCQTIATKMFLEWWVNNKRYYLNGFTSYIEALKKAVSIEADIENDTFNSEKYEDQNKRVVKKYRFSHVYDNWLKQRKIDLARNDIAPSFYPKLVRYGKEFVKFFGDRDIRAIKTADITEFRNSLPSSNSNKTQKNKLGVLHKFFKTQLEHELIDKMPIFPKIHIEAPMLNWLDRETQMKILNFIPVEDRPIIEFLIETGLRPAEVRALKWKNIERDCIHIRASFSNGIYREITKTKNQWGIPMLTRIKAILDKVPRSLITDFVFWYGNGQPYGEKKLRTIWHTACKKAGIDKITLYQGTRHSFGSQHVNNGVPLEIIGYQMGHKHSSTTKKYAQVNKVEAIRRAFER